VSTNFNWLIGTESSVGIGQQRAFLDVGDGSHDSIEPSDDLSNVIHDADLENEERIETARQNIEAAIRNHQRTNDDRHRHDAMYWRIEFERAIAKRSPQQIARMQAQQNERMQREPGAPKDTNV
jgi:uncharacterized membrane protein YccC